MRISTSWLDSFLYWQQSEDAPVEELLKSLKSVEKTPKMLAGIALHKILENATPDALFQSSMDGFDFRFELDAEIDLAPIRELKMEYPLETPWGVVTLVGRVDGINGQIVRDYKLTERFDAERYADSYQWRAYLMMFGAKQFVYDVFSGRIEAHPTGDETKVTVFGYDRMPLCAYPGMEQDVARVVGQLAEVIARYWPERAALE